MSVGVFACCAAVVVATLALTDRGAPSPRVVVGGTPANKAFHPPSYREGNQVVVPITFLTGGSAEVVFPSSLDVSTMRFVPGGAVTWIGSPELGRSLEISRGTIAAQFKGQSPTTTYHDRAGHPVPFYPATSDNRVNQLAFQIGDWVVTVWDYPVGDSRGPAMTDAQRTLWATNLRGHVTKQGFLVLDPIAPLAVTVTDTPDAELWNGTNGIGIIFRACQGPDLQGEPNAQGYITRHVGTNSLWACDPDVPLVFWVSGNTNFQDVAGSLQIRNLREPLPRSTSAP